MTICTTDIDTVHSPDTAHTQHLRNWMQYDYKKRKSGLWTSPI